MMGWDPCRSERARRRAAADQPAAEPDGLEALALGPRQLLSAPHVFGQSIDYQGARRTAARGAGILAQRRARALRNARHAPALRCAHGPQRGRAQGDRAFVSLVALV